MKQRVYLDTSVIGGYHDPEFSRWSIALFGQFERSERVAVISQLTRDELENAPILVRKVLDKLPSDTEMVSITEDAYNLASRYIEEKALSGSHKPDALHIAIAVVERVDILVSWNFRHIVNIDRIHAFNAVNLKSGYNILEIRSPRDVVHEEEEGI